MPHPASHGHHPLHTPKKTLPGDNPPSGLQEKVVILAKINLGVTLVPLTTLALIMLAFYARDDIFAEYGRANNNTYTGSYAQIMVQQDRTAVWKFFFLQFGWACGESILAYVLLVGSKTRDYGYMKAWLILMLGAFFAEIYMQLMAPGGMPLSEFPIVLLATFVASDIYRISCILIVYLLVDEMVERGEVKASPDRDSEYEQ